jgi:ATP/maltotriose-dependent transcriptional regulator MalT
MPFLDRPHLEDRIRAALGEGSVCLHGSLGYGKTTVLRSALRNLGTPVARYDTAPWERDRFVPPLIDALASVRPDFGRRTRALAEAGASPEVLAAAFADDLAHVRAPLVIAIDDAGDIASDETFRAFFRSLASAAPPEVHVAIASRREIASLLRAPVAQFDEADLRFTRDEIARITGATDDATIRRIAEATAGWPAAVALTAAPETIPEITRAALEPFAVCERVEAARVADFHSLGAFIDVDAGWVALQPIVRAQLLETMRARADGSLERAHLAAGADEERGGHFGAALYHYEAAGIDPQTYAFLHRNAERIAHSGELPRVDSLLQRVPGNDSGNAALAAYVRALLEHARGDALAGERFARAAADAERAGDAGVALLASLRTVEFELAHGRSLEPKAMERVRERAALAGSSAATAAAVLEGWNFAIRGAFSQALAALEPHDAPATTREGSGIEIARAYAETSLGSIERARRRMDVLIAALEDSEHVVLHLQALIWYARFALLWGETAIALDYANEAYRRAQGFDAETESAALYASLAEAAAHAGESDVATHWARELRRHAETAWYAIDAHRLAATADQQTARALFARGDHAGARAIADASAAEQSTPPATRAALLADAAAYACVARDGAAVRAIARAREALDAASPLDAVDGVALASASALLDALTIAGGGAPVERDLAVLGPYAVLARARDGSVRLPTAARALRDPKALSSALELFTAHGPRFEAGVLSALARIPHAGAAPRTPLAEPLTEREGQVLELLVEGLTNREIGERLILGTRTVETHVERVLGKLGVGSRTRAIAAALRLGLVTS